MIATLLVTHRAAASRFGKSYTSALPKGGPRTWDDVFFALPEVSGEFEFMNRFETEDGSHAEDLHLDFEVAA